MAGSAVTITQSKTEVPYRDEHGIIKVLIEWLADDTDGSVPDTVCNDINIHGRYCILGVTDPGTTAPSADYDITIVDEYGCDIFGGKLADRSATLSEQEMPLIGTAYDGRVVTGTITFKLANNSVNSAVGKCALYFRL